MPVTSYLPTVLIFLLAGFTQGVSGFGAGLVAMPLLAFFLPVNVAIPLCTLQGLIITGFLAWQLRRHVCSRKVMPLVAGCLPGTYVGISFLKGADPTVLKLLLGLLITSYAIYCLIARPRPRRIKALWAYPAGFATGVISGAFSAGGPPTIIYTTLTAWSKDEIKATLSTFFFITGIFTATGHAVAGITTLAAVQLFWISAPAVLLGVILGSRFYAMINQSRYLTVVFVLLLCTGLLIFGSTLTTTRN